MGKENPIRMAYHPTAKLFGVGCLTVDRATSKGAAAAASSFKLIDAVDFRGQLRDPTFSTPPNMMTYQLLISYARVSP